MLIERQENALPEYSVKEETDPMIRLHVFNMARAGHGYSYSTVDDKFAALLDNLRPEDVHTGHLSHLSTSPVYPARERNVPAV